MIVHDDPTSVSETRRLTFYNPAIDVNPPAWVMEYLHNEAPMGIYRILMGCKLCDRGEFYEEIFEDLSIFYSAAEGEEADMEKEIFTKAVLSEGDKEYLSRAIKRSDNELLNHGSFEEMVLNSVGIVESMESYCKCSKALNSALMFNEETCERLNLTPNLVTSLGENGKQYPCLDLDRGIPGITIIDHYLMEAMQTSDSEWFNHLRQVRVKSTSNEHLYIQNLGMETGDYFIFLKLLERDGYLEPGYVNSSIARGYTSLRLPGETKPYGVEGAKLLREQAKVTMDILVKGLTEVGRKKYGYKNPALPKTVSELTT